MVASLGMIATTSTRAPLENVSWCGAEGHTLSSCTRPSKSKSDTTSKQSTKGKGRSTSTSTPSRPSSTAKPKAQPKAQPKKKSAKGGGKGKKDKPSVKSSTKSSAKAGEVSFDNDDAEEEDHDAECDWDEDEEYVAEEEQGETFADHAFATPYHSHVCVVHDLDDGELEPMGSTVTPGGPQLDATSEEHWTTDEDAIDTAGPTRTPNSPVAQQGPLPRRVPSEQARNAAAAVMRTNFPNMIAEMNPDWDPLTAHDLLHHSDDTSDSVELITSEEEPTEEEHDSDSEERDGFPNIQRVVTYPARLTEDGGIERIGPTEVISEADPTWNQWDQDRWFAHRSDSDYKERAFASTAAHISLPVSAKDSWEWRGSCCLVRVHRQARRCLFTPTWKEDIWHGFKVHPTRKTYVTPVGQKKHLNPVIENVKQCSSLKPRRVAYPWIGETHFKVDPDMCGKRVLRMSARILVPANDMNPVAIADSGASHVILPTSALPEKRAGKLRVVCSPMLFRVECHIAPSCRTGACCGTPPRDLCGPCHCTLVSSRSSHSQIGTHGYLDTTEPNFDMPELFGHGTWINAMSSER